MDINEFLAGKQEEWQDQAARSKEPRQFTRVPDGTYDMTLDTVELTTSQSSGDPVVLWKYVVSDGGEYHGEQVYDRDGMTREDAFYWLWIKLAKFGYDPDDYQATDLPAILEELTANEPRISGQLKTKGEWQNLTIRAVLAEDEEEAAAPAPPTPAKKPAPAPAKPAAKAAPAKPAPAPAKPAPAPAKPAPAKPAAKAAPAAPAAPAKPAAKPTPPAKPAPAPKAKPAPAPEPEPEPEEEDVTLEEGMAVEFPWGEEQLAGTIDHIDEPEAEGDEATVYVLVGDLLYPVPLSDIVVPEGE